MGSSSAMATIELAVPPVAEAVPTARHRFQALLEGMGIAEAVRETAVLVVSELVTNGVIHDGGQDIILRAFIGDDDIRIEVLTADKPSGPTADVRPEEETGRGLSIVEAFTTGLA